MRALTGKRNGPPGASAPTKRALTFACFVTMPDGRVRAVEDLTPEEKTEWQRRMLRRLSEDMSDYYTQHPAEYARL